jgi:hypothetical protein
MAKYVICYAECQEDLYIHEHLKMRGDNLSRKIECPEVSRDFQQCSQGQKRVAGVTELVLLSGRSATKAVTRILK